jgi:hypothetical protein
LRYFACECGESFSLWRWNTDPLPICGTCHRTMDERGDQPFGSAPGVFSDSIPGGVWIRHGICHDDGTPKRYDSLTDIRKAAAAKGLTIYGETPKPREEHSHD